MAAAAEKKRNESRRELNRGFSRYLKLE